MPDKNSDPETETTRRADLAPETFNDEQDDEDAQAQTLADEALGRNPGDWGSPTESMVSRPTRSASASGPIG